MTFIGLLISSYNSIVAIKNPNFLITSSKIHGKGGLTFYPVGAKQKWLDEEYVKQSSGVNLGWFLSGSETATGLDDAMSVKL